MDVSLNNVLETTRKYFQGVPPAAVTGSGGGHPNSHIHHQLLPPTAGQQHAYYQPQVTQQQNSPPGSRPSSNLNGSGPPHTNNSNNKGVGGGYQMNTVGGGALPNGNVVTTGTKNVYQSLSPYPPYHGGHHRPSSNPPATKPAPSPRPQQQQPPPPPPPQVQNQPLVNGGSGGRSGYASSSPSPSSYAPYYQQQHQTNIPQQQSMHHIHHQSSDEMKQNHVQQSYYQGQPYPQQPPPRPSPAPSTGSNGSCSGSVGPTQHTVVPPPPSLPPHNTNTTSTGVVKRESPLDLSVKTVRQSADSTGQFDGGSNGREEVAANSMYYYQGNNAYQQTIPNNYHHQPHPSLQQQRNSPYNLPHPSQNQQQQHPNSPQYQQYPVNNSQPPTVTPKDFMNYPQQQHHPHQQYQDHNKMASHQQRWKDNVSQQLQHHHQPSSRNQQQQVQTMPHPPPPHQQQYQQLPSMASSFSKIHYPTAGAMPKLNYPHESSSYPQNYLKRPSTSNAETDTNVGAPTAPKQTRHDPWRQSIDQEIEKRFNSYLSSKKGPGVPGPMVNGDVTSNNKSEGTTTSPAVASSFPPSGNGPYYQDLTPMLQKGATAASNGVGGADKRVLSILRNSLETKEARNMQMQQNTPTSAPQLVPQGHLKHQQQQMSYQQPPQSQQTNTAPRYTELTNSSAARIVAHQQRHPLPFQTPIERLPPSHMYSRPVPKAVDSVQQYKHNGPKCEPTSEAVGDEDQSGYLPPNNLSTSSKEYDGLAAFLAARIRTKAELKQPVGSERAATPSSSNGISTSSLSSSSFLSPLNDLVKYSGESVGPSSSSKSSPWPLAASTNNNKMTKEQVLAAASLPRRRLFSRTEEDGTSMPTVGGMIVAPGPGPQSSSSSSSVGATAERADTPATITGGAATTAQIPPRAPSSGLRSSSEASVFDFRDSDSEAEAPPPTLTDRRRSSLGSLSGSGLPVTVKTEVDGLDELPEEDHQKWLNKVSELLEQLERDRSRMMSRMNHNRGSGGWGRRGSGAYKGKAGGGRGAVMSDQQVSCSLPTIPPSMITTPKMTSTGVGTTSILDTIKKEEPSADDHRPSLVKTETPSMVATSTSTDGPATSGVPVVKLKKEIVSDNETSSAEENEEVRRVMASTPILTTPIKMRGGPGSRGGRGRGGGRGGGGRGRRTKKPSFGDGSDFRTPGWEEEVYRFKKALRMPARLITISRPPGWPRAPLSLPDLETYPDSPMTNDSADTFPAGGSKCPSKEEAKEDQKSIAKSLGEEKSFLDRLMAKYCARKRKPKKEKVKPSLPSENRLTDNSGAPELMPTPSLQGPKDAEYLGFRKETVNEYREEFLKTGTFTAEADLPPVVLETRTRTENKAFKERLTIREVFGAERPASAPPPGTTRDDLRRRQRLRRDKQTGKRKRMLVRARKEVRETGGGGVGGGGGGALGPMSGVGGGRAADVGSGGAGRVVGRLKYKPFRRKLKSSGFDYIRKKKKTPVPKKDPDAPSKERKKPKKTQPLSEQEIQAEIKNWVLNKGLGETILHRASRIGNVDVVRYCLEKLQHNPCPRDNAGYTPLHEACSRGHVQVASLLLQNGANVSDSALGGVRPLHEAAENGFIKVIKLLLDHGADPLLATYSGNTALSLTTDEEARQMMELHVANCNTPPPSVPTEKCDEPSTKPVDSFSQDPAVFNNISGGDNVPTPPPHAVDGIEIEESDSPLPSLYRLSGESRHDSWVLFHELAPLLRVKSKEALLKQLGQESSSVIREMKLQDFFAKAHSRAIKSTCNLGSAPKMPKLTLVKYTDTVKFLLGVETCIIPR